jgi:hypothetical protein
VAARATISGGKWVSATATFSPIPTTAHDSWPPFDEDARDLSAVQEDVVRPLD